MTTFSVVIVPKKADLSKNVNYKKKGQGNFTARLLDYVTYYYNLVKGALF